MTNVVCQWAEVVVFIKHWQFGLGRGRPFYSGYLFLGHTFRAIWPRTIFVSHQIVIVHVSVIAIYIVCLWIFAVRAAVWSNTRNCANETCGKNVPGLSEWIASGWGVGMSKCSWSEKRQCPNQECIVGIYLLQESEIKSYKDNIDRLLKGENLEEEPELVASFTENSKLKHRLAILNRVSTYLFGK